MPNWKMGPHLDLGQAGLPVGPQVFQKDVPEGHCPDPLFSELQHRAFHKRFIYFVADVPPGEMKLVEGTPSAFAWRSKSSVRTP